MNNEEWCKKNCPYSTDCACDGVCNFVLSLLKDHEAVEPVKLVRCKNCKHCDSERIDKNMIWCKIHQFGRPDDYYCADGIEK